MLIKEAITKSQVVLGKVASKYFPIIREFCRQALCKSARFIATLQMRGYINKFFKRGKDICAHPYNRCIVRSEYTSRDLALLFIVAILIGASIKSIATDTITMGFDDYTLAPEGVSIDLNTVQKQVLSEGGSLTLSRSIPAGGVCSQ